MGASGRKREWVSEILWGVETLAYSSAGIAIEGSERSQVILTGTMSECDKPDAILARWLGLAGAMGLTEKRLVARMVVTSLLSPASVNLQGIGRQATNNRQDRAG